MPWMSQVCHSMVARTAGRRAGESAVIEDISLARFAPAQVTKPAGTIDLAHVVPLRCGQIASGPRFLDLATVEHRRANAKEEVGSAVDKGVHHIHTLEACVKRILATQDSNTEEGHPVTSHRNREVAAFPVATS
eukprot:CAMPEP_0117500878 /NCGR_PEP_ID=MMETSP0784-20121206/23005_1 /TAXON_ID=39447 /ORGANISM="" /LENGTH=133 /DNA_ID=CAMNT_0005296105 /DNA_START=267 /DNA_END=668 /DNA_ORIENTATION=-